MRYQGVIFDLDGTLSNSVPCILKCAALTHRKLGLPWDEQEQRAVIGQPLYQIARRWLPEERVAEYLAVSRGFNQQYLGEMVEPFPGIIPMLQQLHQQGVKLCVVTSRLKWGADLSCEKIGAAPYLTRIIGVEDTETHKPEPEPALLALSVMKLSPEQVVFVGDSPVDILCGQRTGTDTIGVGWGVTPAEKLRAEHPTYYCPDVAALSKILLG